MRRLGVLALLLLWTFSVAAPAEARAVIIESSAPLGDHSEGVVTSAVLNAVETAIRGAASAGLTPVAFRQAFMFEDRVVVQILATDDDADPDADEDGDAGEPGARPRDDHSSRVDL